MTNVTKTSNRTAWLFLTLMGVLTLSGCTSTMRMLTPTFDELEAKVLRVEVTDGSLRMTAPEVETPGAVGTKLYDNPRVIAFYGGDPNDTHVAPEDVVPYRWNLIMARGIWKEPSLFGTGGFQGGPFPALAADGIPLLKNGDWVDVYTPPAKTFSMRNHSFMTIVRLVCTVEDKDCQKQEKKKLGRVQGQLVQPKGTFDWDSVTITPHFTLDGQWLPGKEVFRPKPGNSGN
jgi:hypothetical protein